MIPNGLPGRRFLLFRRLVWIAVCVVVAYMAAVFTLFRIEDRLLYHPVPASQRWIEPPSGFVVQDVHLHTADDIGIHARWFPCAEAQGAVLICHSRAGNLSLELKPAELAAWHRRVGCSVLIFDYPGYGQCEGQPSEAGCYGAAQAAYAWLTQNQRIPPRQVLIYGRSLGSAVAVDLASQYGHRALILVSPFPSLPDVALSQFPLLPAHQFMHNRFPSLAKIGLCTQPVFIVHGTRDHLVPFALGQHLFAAANEPKRMMPVRGAQHGDCVTATCFDALRQFLLDVESASPLAVH
jgi:fermentation-respiration switch protein FrsA (DUF1100 family)